MSEIQVRYGVPADVHNFMDLTTMCAEENGLLAVSTKKVLEEVWASLNCDHGVIGVIEGEEGILEAGILLRVDTTPYSVDEVLCERAIYVRPEYRKVQRSLYQGGRASYLCEFAKNAATRLELPLLISILSTHRAAGKVRLYERHFGPPAGAYWLWNAKTGHKQEAAE
jgi:hypothetical protein